MQVLFLEPQNFYFFIAPIVFFGYNRRNTYFSGATMKNRGHLFAKLFTALTGGVLLCLAAASCDNFLKAEQIKDDIVDIIDYYNSPSYIIKVEGV